MASILLHGGTVIDVLSDKLELADVLMEDGVITLPKPVSEPVMSQMLRTLCSVRERLRRAEERQVTVEKKIEELRLVNRAKWLLIERLHMTEEDAHGYIRRQAMNKRVTQREAAEDILRTYQ